MRLRDRSRHPRAAHALLGALLAAAVLAGCSEVTVTTPTPTPPPPTDAPTLPPIGFNHRYGNTPVAALDGLQLERTLLARKQYWEAAVATMPVEAGYVSTTDPQAVTRARSSTATMFVVIATEALSSIESLLAGGDAAQQRYAQSIVESVRAKGYTGLSKVTMYIYFGEANRHAQLDWSAKGGYAYRIFDNDLKGIGLPKLPVAATPFPDVPLPSPSRTP